MASARDLKNRIKSVGNISQITKAMEAVSATKMRKSQQFAINARPYAVASLEMMQNLLSRVSVLPPLLTARPVKTSALLIVTSDKGLAGAFNSSVIRKAEGWINAQEKSGLPYRLITVGKLARDHFNRKNANVVESFLKFGDFTGLDQTLPVAELVLDGFRKGDWDKLDAIYMNFKSTLKQEVAERQVLPATKDGIEEIVAGILPEHGRYSESDKNKAGSGYKYEYKLEPSAEEILEKLVSQLLRMHIHHIILESNASEHSARMVAMKSASDNASELISDLSLVYNKVRQAGITRELAEITAGTEALSN